jgi:hypothetical protein
VPSTSNGSPTLSRSPSRRLGFLAPAPAEETDGLLSSEPPSPTSPPATGEGSPLGDVEPELGSDQYDDGSTTEDDWFPEGTPSAAPSPASSPNPLNAEGLQDVFRGGVMIAGDQAHRLLANTPGKQAVGLYQATPDDAAAIGDPLARIAGRHQGVGEVNPDTADLLAAMVGLTRFATRQVERNQRARQLDAGQTPEPEAVDL